MSFLDPDFPEKFELFTTSHIVVMVVIAVLWIAIPLEFKRRKNEKWDLVFRYVLAALLIGQYLGWVIWEIATGRFTLELSLDLSKEEIEQSVLSDERTQKYLAGRTPKKIIVVPGKIVNVVG